MMNFRYHLVSLIAVFLALAVGVVLGAGPLQTRIARSAQEVSSTSAAVESDAVRNAQVRASLEGKGIVALSQAMVGSLLSTANVVTVALPGTDHADVTSARDALTRAGAKLAGAVTLTDNWDAQGMDQYRQTLSTALSSRVPNIPAGATADDVIGYALVNILTTAGAERDIAAEILTDASTPIVTLDEDPKGGAHSIVVIGPRDSAKGLVPDRQERLSRSVTAWAGLARAIATAPKSGVVVGDAQSPNSMLSQIRSLNVPVTTVDQVGTESANLAMVGALPTAAAQARSFGFAEGVTAPFPPLPKLN